MSARPRRRALLLLVPLLVAALPLRATAAGPPSLCTVRHPSDARVAWTCRRLRAGESLDRLFGYPASYGCVGLADERMQRDYYGQPAGPVPDGARRLDAWVLPTRGADDRLHALPEGPRVRFVGRAP